MSSFSHIFVYFTKKIYIYIYHYELASRAFMQEGKLVVPNKRLSHRCKMAVMFACLCLVKLDSPFLQMPHSFRRAK